MIPDEEILEWINSSTAKMANRYPDIKLLAHKDVFANAMQFCSDLDPETFDFIPPTFQFPSQQDYTRFMAYSEKNPKATYIAKP